MTKKPISTISFNSSSFLDVRLSDMVSSGSLQSYIYIKHFAEKDTTKDHHHLILIPNRPIDPQSVRRQLHEPSLDRGKPDLGCLPFQASKIEDWFLYALHYPPYLLKKGLVRVNTYSIDDFRTNESVDFLADIFSRAFEGLTDSRISMFLDRMKRGESFGSILASGLVPANQIVFYDKLYRLNAHLLGVALEGDQDVIPF